MKPKIWPVTACLLLLIAANSLPLTAEEKDDYVKALGSEAKSTSTEKDPKAAAATNTEADPSPTPSKDADNTQLTEKVISVLEKTLIGSAPEGVSQDVIKAAEDQEAQALRQGLQSVVSDALDEGTKIDDIRQAVETALLGFHEKQPEVKTAKLQSINEMMRSILTEGSELAEGNPKDAYIALLQGELDDTIVTTASNKAKAENKATKSQSADTTQAEEKKADTKPELNKAEEKKAEAKPEPSKAEEKVDKKTELAEADNKGEPAKTEDKAEKTKLAKVDNEKEPADNTIKDKAEADSNTSTAKSTEQSKEEINKAVAKSPASEGKQGDKYVAKLKDEAKMTFVTIQEGDTLSKIAIRVYGTNKRYWDLFKANQDILGDNPDLLLPGQVLKVPK